MAERKSDRPKIMAALPAYNEESHIGTVVLKVKQYVDEIIVVDDGSQDQTAKVARLAGASVVPHRQNKGYGASIQELLARAKKRKPDILVLLDADGQHNPDEIPALIGPVSAGFDLVIGSRVGQEGKIPCYRRFGQRVLAYFSRTLSKQDVLDSECGFRALSLRAINELELKQKGMAVSAEMVADAAEKGLKVTEVPVSAIYTKDGSTLNPVAHGMSNLTWIITLISERRPLFFFGVTGIVLLGIGVLAAVRVLLISSSTEGVVAVGSALLAVLFFILGIFTVFTGIILNILVRWRG